jgi:hypothetical protein
MELERLEGQFDVEMDIPTLETEKTDEPEKVTSGSTEDENE